MSLWVMLSVLLSGLAAGGLAWSLASSFADSARTYSDTYEDEMTQTLESMFLFIPAHRLMELGWMAAGTIFLLVMLPFCRFDKPLLLLSGLLLAALFSATAFCAPRMIVNLLRRRRREHFDLQLLDALPMMSNALRAGFSINQAFESVAEGTSAPMKQEVSLFLQQMRVGMSFYEALEAFDQRMNSEDLTLVITAIDIARRTGGNLTEIFDTIAATIRGRIRIHQHVKTLTAQGRLQGLIIGAMPFLLGIGMTLFKPRLMIPFICSFSGAITLVAVSCFVALGAWMIRKIVTIDV
ncbi:MAG: type II secretion system F family protein [Kiritimatiellia bacterium]